MTNKIKILTEQEAQKIAAGEVVERPASIVKETIENSIDAGATQISLYIEKAGKQLVRIVDNGCGMSPDDAKLCFSAHATSKITTLHDLEQIRSFGFRGEALATISAVSKVTLITKSQITSSNPSTSSGRTGISTKPQIADSQLGTKLQLENGTFVKNEQIACPVGTDLQIHDLFYNTPVRKKFLKQDETEWNQILNIYQAFCLSNLDIHFKLFRDNKLILNAPAVKTIKERASQIWGHNFSENLTVLKNHSTLQCASLTQGRLQSKINLSGVISKHNFWRYGRQQIFFFVNNRAVKNKELSKALMKGYLNVLPPARFPAAFIFMTMPTDMVDINVHPRKEEVRFAKPVRVENYVQRAIKQTLENSLSKQFQPPGLRSDELPPSHECYAQTGRRAQQQTIQPTFQTPDFAQDNVPASVSFLNNHERKKSSLISFDRLRMSDENTTPTSNLFKNTKFKSAHPEPVEGYERTYTSSKSIKAQMLIPKETQTNIGCSCSSSKKIPAETQPYSKVVGQLLNTYIIVENEQGLVLIDQHAAHERIMYEKFLKNFEKKEGTVLMFPEVVELSTNQIKIILDEKEFFAQQGIELEQLGKNEIAIKTSPPKLQNQSLKELIFEVIAFIEENGQLEHDVFRKKLNEHTHAQMACKMAVKAGDVLTQQLMQQIINDLSQTDNRFICAHGRPTTWSMSRYQIEKNFKRK